MKAEMSARIAPTKNNRNSCIQPLQVWQEYRLNSVMSAVRGETDTEAITTTFS